MSTAPGQEFLIKHLFLNVFSNEGRSMSLFLWGHHDTTRPAAERVLLQQFTATHHLGFGRSPRSWCSPEVLRVTGMLWITEQSLGPSHMSGPGVLLEQRDGSRAAWGVCLPGAVFRCSTGFVRTRSACRSCFCPPGREQR